MWELAIASLIGSMYAADATNQQSAENVNSANAFNERMNKTRYQMMTQDLKAAGLNPMLAYSQQPGSVAPSQVPQNQNVGGAGITAFLSARSNAAAVAQQEAQADKIIKETELLDTQKKLMEADILLKGSSANVNEKQATLIEDNMDKIHEEILNLRSDRERIWKTTEMLVEQAKLLGEKGYTEQQSRALMEQQIKKMSSETKLLDFDVDAAASMGNVGREAGQFRWLFDILRGVIRTR